MISTFFGVEIARRAIQTATDDIDVVGHNIANASTTGYTEEVAQNTATDPYTVPMLNNPSPAQFGTGVKVSQITRSVDPWVNGQVNTSNSDLNYWETLNNQLQVAQSAFQEPTSIGIQSAMDNFFNSWQTLSGDPSNMGARATVVSDAQALIGDFHTSAGLLGQTAGNIQTQMAADVNGSNSVINQMGAQIAALNQQIASVSAQGEQPNDLEDKRDQLISQLSQLVPVTVKNYDNGTADVSIYGAQLVAASSSVANTVSLTTVADTGSYSGYDNVLNIYDGTSTVPVNLTTTTYSTGGGTLTGLEAARQKTGNYLGQLDTLAYNLAQEVNTQHQAGYDYNGNPGGLFFATLSTTTGSAANIALSTNISPNANGANPNLDAIAAAATTSDPRDGTNALAMYNLQSTTYAALNNGTFDGWYQTTTETVGADVQNAAQMQQTAQATNTQLVNMQQSVSGVSTDDEMTRLVQFQYAYQAAAQFLSVQGKMLDTLINGTLQ